MRKKLIIETPMSKIYLDRKYAYKMKKPIVSDSVDFTDINNRKRFCDIEFSLNKRMCEDMYIGVVPVKSLGKFPRFTGAGKPVDYAVKMKRLPQKRLMINLMKKNMLESKDITDIARIIANFHVITETNDEISECGNLSNIRDKWAEIFVHAESLPDSFFPDYSYVKSSIKNFMHNNEDLFQRRVAKGRIKWCHGNLKPSNVFVLRGCVGTMRRIYIFDCMEYDNNRAWIDVAADIASMCVELDLNRKRRFVKMFAEDYRRFSNDKDLPNILDFYKCLCAFSKSVSNAADGNVKKSKEYFSLVATYSASLPR